MNVSPELFAEVVKHLREAQYQLYCCASYCGDFGNADGLAEAADLASLLKRLEAAGLA